MLNWKEKQVAQSHWLTGNSKTDGQYTKLPVELL